MDLAVETLGPFIKKGQKDEVVGERRVRQLLSGNKAEVERGFRGLYHAAKAKGWTDERITLAVRALAPEYSGALALGMLDETNPTTPYIRDLLARSAE
jgi:hypothetical protein